MNLIDIEIDSIENKISYYKRELDKAYEKVDEENRAQFAKNAVALLKVLGVKLSEDDVLEELDNLISYLVENKDTTSIGSRYLYLEKTYTDDKKYFIEYTFKYSETMYSDKYNNGCECDECFNEI